MDAPQHPPHADPTPDEELWLDEEEMAAWLAVVSLFVRLPSALDAQLRRDAGLSHFEYQILAGLSMTECHTMRMSELAHFTDASLSRLSHAVSRLEVRGWVSRESDIGDGRITVARLTDEGMTKVEESAPGHVAAVRELVLAPLTQTQIRQLGNIAGRIVDAVEGAGGAEKVSHQ